MKTLILTILLLVPVLASGQETRDTTINPRILNRIETRSKEFEGEKCPEFVIKKADSTIFSNANFKGKVVFINIWYEKCPPCIAEIEGLKKLYASLRNNSNFLFISFTFEPDQTIEKFIKKYNLNYKILHLDQKDCVRLNYGYGFPTNIILDKNGIIKFFMLGGIENPEIATKLIMTEIYPRIKNLL